MKTKKHFVIINCFFLLFLGKLFGQSDPPKTKAEKFTINGYIKEKGSGEHLPMVSIYTVNGKTGTTTNDYGFFSLTLPKGTHELVISYVGYTTLKKKIDLKQHTKLNIEMTISENKLDEVVVNSNQLTNESQVSQMSVVSLKPSDIENIPAILGEKDVIKTLQLLPGIQRGSEGSAGFFVRGGTPDQNLIILDEAPVYNSNHLFGFISVFNGDALKSIETFKGGFPARFGGRLSSVLKINTKNGNKEKIKGKFKIGLLSSSVVLEGPINKDKTSFLISGRRSYIDLLLKPLMDKNKQGGYYFTDLNFKIHHIFNDKNKLYWSNYFGRDSFYANGEDINVNLGWGNITSTLRWNHQFNDRFFANTSLIFSNYTFGIDTKSSLDNEHYFFKLNSGINDYGVKLDFDYYPTPQHTLRFGVASTYHNFVPKQSRTNQTNGENSSVKQHINSIENAAYLEDDWKINTVLRFSPGIRFTHFKYKSKNYLNFEPRATVSWNVKTDLALKVSYAKMNQYIHLLSNSGIGLPTDLWVSSTDKLKPQSSEQFALGLAKDFLDKGYSLTFEGYYKTMDDIISYKEGASFLLLENIETGQEIDWEDNITSGKGWAYGGEFLLKKKLGKLTGWLGYTLSWSERQFDEVNGGKKFFARYDRRHDFSLVGNYKPNDRITLSGSWVYSSGDNFNLADRVALGNSLPITSNINYRNNINPFITERNNFRAESFHRLDLGIQFHKNFTKNRQRTWEFSVYNLYGRKNPFFYDFDFNSNLKKYSLLQFIPSISYTYKF